jgi:hypothetical protein
METWEEALMRVENPCTHEGVECEPIMVCSEGCKCGCAERQTQFDLTEVLSKAEFNRPLTSGYGDPGTETKKL